VQGLKIQDCVEASENRSEDPEKTSAFSLRLRV